MAAPAAPNPPDELARLVSEHVREVPNFPRAGILFRDLTRLFADGPAFGRLIDLVAEEVEADGGTDLVGGIEARGFLLASALAYRLGVGVLPIRKAGKLPPPTLTRTYALEYAAATIEFPTGVAEPGARVVLIDDVLATGGTLTATADLLRELGAVPGTCWVLMELAALGGAAVLAEYRLPLRAALSV